MERIWAPWRMTYISNTAHETGCIFCRAGDTDDDRERLVLTRRKYTLTMLNRYPYTCGHMMVAPLRHTAEMNDLNDDELLDLMHAVRSSCDLLREVSKPEGINIGINLGKAAGAGVEEHLHIHIVPRWNGDTNFMSVVGDVRVIPEGLLESYDRLAAILKAQKKE